MASISLFVLLTTLFAFTTAQADEVIYTDNALASGWQDWSWGSTIVYNATEMEEGTSSIFVNSTAYSALSLKAPSTFETFAGLEFDISGAQPDLSIIIQDTVDNTQSATIPLSALSTSITANNFTSILLNFNNIPPNGATLGNGSWDRITFQAGTNGAVYYIDNIQLISVITIAPQILSAEPILNNLVAVTTSGNVNFSSIGVKLNGKTLPVTDLTTFSPIDTPSISITYLKLASSFAPGDLNIASGNTSFSFVLPARQSANVDESATHTISDRIYGVNFPTDASYIEDLGVTISRWGGNAVTAYNPFGDFTNAGNDWYFENRANDNADAWIEWVAAAGSDTLFTIPALDWVSKDATSYSYPFSTYPDQESFDPYNGVAGDGLFPNGSYVTPVPDQNNVYVPWNTTIAKQWLTDLVNKPTIVTIDNEMEIASNTHQDMHPQPMGYDEELARVINFSTIAKEAISGVEVAAPSTCSWWYYWTSEIGLSDNAAHNNTDFLPWFLTEMKLQEQKTGKRLLDFLDIHYYFQADTSANDDAAKALRLRLTRSFWDPTYVDESWIGTNTPSNNQPNPNVVELIPRMRTLLSQLYPGTKLSVSEWSSTDDTDITGGLVTVDSLGIFGRYQLDSATYWSDPDETGPIGLAYWLYRGYGVQFGNLSLKVNISNFNPDTLGVYASKNDRSDNGLSLVIVNKDPNSPVALQLSGVPTGNYVLRHFGGQAGVAKFQTTVSIHSASYIVVPSYTAVFLQQTSNHTT
ncbi:glycoside hydrolase family 44 protein [Ramaria rubella]|nr:glycoside hydrolase family 44 protein [Ramaria rubella]